MAVAGRCLQYDQEAAVVTNDDGETKGKVLVGIR